ncbi:MAG TPA: class I SAM-dependent methyltransferase, partial [Flavobacterium sp.]
DSWVTYLLESKREFRGHFDFYNEIQFEKEYSAYFHIVKKEQIQGSERILYSMRVRNHKID